MGESVENEKSGGKKVKKKTQRIEGLSRYPSFSIPQPLRNEREEMRAPRKMNIFTQSETNQLKTRIEEVKYCISLKRTLVSVSFFFIWTKQNLKIKHIFWIEKRREAFVGFTDSLSNQFFFRSPPCNRCFSLIRNRRSRARLIWCSLSTGTMKFNRIEELRLRQC